MAEKEAIEAAAEALWNYRPMAREYDGSPKPWPTLKPYQHERYRGMARAALAAALPDTLHALADNATSDRAAAAERFRTAPTATERVDASQWGDVCELAAVYLRARAEEARRG